MSDQFDNLVRLMARLRAPDGCPWDRKQTHESLKPYLLEEAYEVLETIDRGESTLLQEELGDLLLQVLFHAQIAAESQRFSMNEVMEQLAEKLVRRHPHVFGGPDQKQSASNADQVLSRWEEIKRSEREQQGDASSALDGVPKTLPALLRAYQIQARASRVGFDWPEAGPVLEKLEEEIAELREAVASAAQPSKPVADSSAGSGQESDGLTRMARVEAEFGDVLFSMVNLARFLKVNPEEALRTATNRFMERFHYVEAQAAKTGRTLSAMTLAEMDALWNEAKQRTVAASRKPDASPKRS
jgi:tetrapyrrole methylase family protein / MazG family protein